MKQNDNLQDLAHLESFRSKLSPAEVKILDYIVQHPLETIYLSAAELGEKAGASTATVIRCSKGLGFKGYTHLKMALVRLVNTELAPLIDEVSSSDDVYSVIGKVFSKNTRSLENAMVLLDAEQLHKSAELIAKAKEIIILGVGTSGITAQELNYKMLRLGLPSVYFFDFHTQVLSCANSKPSSLAIIVSHSGNTLEIVEVARLLKSKNVPIIALTNHESSPLTEFTDIVLRTPVPETPFSSGDIASTIVQLAVVDCLYVAISLIIGPEAIKSVEETAEAVLFTKY